MREIKFRGKRVDTGEWVYGHLTETIDGECISILEIDKTYFFPVISETVGQFTGLKDYKGTPVYEGDLLVNTKREKKLTYFVLYQEDEATYNIQRTENILKISLWESIVRKHEVIGNIHDEKDDEKKGER